ncbi:hypothetical protein [Methylobacterium sp. NEAU K]|uniref:hypothetical protein n=1 Tax=Methylobacterium sp. NEAU K TaxID=3064946 RepID=UPI0027356252|nr:hypothetical protein [Methylobacterium sp. NEAU K]MDP4005884.1 hypothetical protein [Methylobacterium sp. NEAU K]
MASRVPDRATDGQGADAPADGGRPASVDRRSEQGSEKTEAEKTEVGKAETEIAAGDVADDLADFA